MLSKARGGVITAELRGPNNVSSSGIAVKAFFCSLGIEDLIKNFFPADAQKDDIAFSEFAIGCDLESDCRNAGVFYCEPN